MSDHNDKAIDALQGEDDVVAVVIGRTVNDGSKILWDLRTRTDNPVSEAIVLVGMSEAVREALQITMHKMDAPLN